MQALADATGKSVGFLISGGARFHQTLCHRTAPPIPPGGRSPWWSGQHAESGQLIG